MWDVIWTDPDKELVGEHRARKEKEDTLNKDHKNQPRRRSASTASSRWSTDSPFAIFRARGSKKANTVCSNAHVASPASSVVASPAMASSDRSTMSKASAEGNRRNSSRVSASFLERFTSIESPLNTSPLVSEKTDDAREKFFLRPVIDDASFSPLPTKRLSMIDCLSDDLTESEKMKSLIRIFGRSPSIAKAADDDPSSSKEATVAPDSSVNRPVTPPLASKKKSTTSSSSPTTELNIRSPAIPIPRKNSLLRPADSSIEMPITPNNPEAWKPVDEWDDRPLLRGSPEGALNWPVDLASSSSGVAINKNFVLLREAVINMANTKASDILTRLETLWKSVAKKNVPFLLSDSPEVEELRRWMLSTMIHMDQVPALDRQVVPRRESPLTARMVIPLYDSQATVAYLAALEPTKQFYHLSQRCIPKDELFANVQMISVSKVSPAEFPVAPRIYESVHSLILPSLCSFSLIPGILSNVYKCLNKQGFLRLILIDPFPRTLTMGRNMKMWIEENLLRNLAKEGKCMSPSTAFPPLLGKARLRGDGSTLTTTKFYAVPSSATSRDVDAVQDNVQKENEAKAQVRSLIGRMLWVEVWGPYVTSNKWWWDDPACVAECLELGTFWEYHTVKGVKEPKVA